MTIYFPNGNYGPICDIIPEPTPEPVIVEVELQDPTEAAAPQTTAPLSLPSPQRCRSVTITTKYSPDGPYGPVCDLITGEGDASYYDCPNPIGQIDKLVKVPKCGPELIDAIGDFGGADTNQLECIELQDGQLFCYDPRINNGCSAADYEDILDDMSVLATRCSNLPNVGLVGPKAPPPTVYPQLICGSIQRMSSPGVYVHTTPTDITYLNLVMIGAGGGAGGGDDQRYTSSYHDSTVAGAGRGNNSGGCGSMIRLTLSLDPSRRNVITSVVGGGGESGLHYTRDRKKLPIPFNGGGIGGYSGPKGKSGGGGYGGGASAFFVNGQLVASVGGGGGGAGAGCQWFLDDNTYYHKNVLCFATGGKGGLDDIPVGPMGRVHVGVGHRGGAGADDDPSTGKYGGGAGGRFFTGDGRNAATTSGKGGGGGHGVDLDGNALTNGGTTSTANGAAGGAYGGGGGGNAPGGSGGAGGAGAARIKYGSTTLTYTTPGTFTWTVPSGVTSLDEVVCISGGGSGHKDANGDDEGGGGGGGAYAYDVDVPVTPGAVLTIVVGSGGATRSTQGSNNGGNTYIKSSNDNDGYDPGPWGNWQNHRVEGSVTSPIAKTDDDSGRQHYGLLKLLCPKYTNPPVFPVEKPHPIWSRWMEKNAVWINQGEPNYAGQIVDIRLNLDCQQTGSWTFKVMCDDKLAVYIAPWYDTGATNYIDGGRFYNGEPTTLSEVSPAINAESASPWPTTLPANISGASTWQRVLTQNFNANSSSPATHTYTISTTGRYVFRFLLYNQYNAGSEWNNNPSGMGVEIFRPDGKKVWDTGSTYSGRDGSDLLIGDGGGGGGGGGSSGRGGITSYDLGVTEGSCLQSDSTAFGGSAGKTYILDSPAVSVTYFNQAVAGFHAGYMRPGTGDASYRHGTGGYGGGRPTKFSIIFNGIEYPLYNESKLPYDVVIPGMGNGVWLDAANGKEFPFHYSWGKYGGNPTGASSLQRLSRGVYEAASNTSIRSGQTWYEPRAFELALWWNPVKQLNGTWNTTVRLRGIPKWARGTGWNVGDTVTGKFPPAKGDGTQPWIDMVGGHGFDQWSSGLRKSYNYFGDIITNTNNSFFTFQIKVTEIDNGGNRIIPGTNGDAGHIRYQYGYALAASTPGTVLGDTTTQESTITNTYPSPNDNADDPAADENTGT